MNRYLIDTPTCPQQLILGVSRRSFLFGLIVGAGLALAATHVQWKKLDLGTAGETPGLPTGPIGDVPSPPDGPVPPDEPRRSTVLPPKDAAPASKAVRKAPPPNTVQASPEPAPAPQDKIIVLPPSDFPVGPGK